MSSVFLPFFSSIRPCWNLTVEIPTFVYNLNAPLVTDGKHYRQCLMSYVGTLWGTDGVTVNLRGGSCPPLSLVACWKIVKWNLHKVHPSQVHLIFFFCRTITTAHSKQLKNISIFYFLFSLVGLYKVIFVLEIQIKILSFILLLNYIYVLYVDNIFGKRLHSAPSRHKLNPS